MNIFQRANHVYKQYKRQRMKGWRFVRYWLRLNLNRYKWPKWDIALALLLIVGEVIATVFAGVSWTRDGWSFGMEFAVFVGSAALMIYVFGAIIRGHLPFIKPSLYEQRRRYASLVLGVNIPYSSYTRGGKPGPIVLNNTKNGVLVFVGELYIHDLLDNGNYLTNLSTILHPFLWKQVNEAVDLLHSNRPEVIISSSKLLHPTEAAALHKKDKDNNDIEVPINGDSSNVD